MPRLHQPPVVLSATVLIAVAFPPALRSAAIAAATGTLLEALPFVLASALLPRGRLLRAFDFLGCGCGTTSPGACSLPAIGLCWLAFGPFVALARAFAGVVLATGPIGRFIGSPSSAQGCAIQAPRPDPLASLARLAPQALAGALLAEGLRSAHTFAWPEPLATMAAIGGGLLLGILMPCATGAVAIAASLRSIAPAATVALLVTAGIVRFPPGGPGPTTLDSPDSRGGRGAERLGFALLAGASAMIACRGPSGFVNPRFVIPLGLVALAGAALARYPQARSTARFPAAVPVLLLLATIAGSPLPERAIAATMLDDPYVGERVHFVGALATSGGTAPEATLVRYTITCCRADAQARAVRLNRPLAGAPGTWYDARGVLETGPDGAFELHVATIDRITPPADPFAYR